MEASKDIVRDGNFTLKTKRLAVEDGYKGVPHFNESYMCGTCKDMYVLQWIPDSQSTDAIPVTFSQLPNPPNIPTKVFCPQCKSKTPYGVIQGLEKPPAPMEVIEYIETQMARLHNANEGGFNLHINVEKIVIVVSGKWPDGMVKKDKVSIAFTFCAALLKPDLDKAMQTQPGPPLSFNIVLISNEISDESNYVRDLLERTVYKDINFGTRIYLTSPMLPLKAPFNNAMVVLVGYPLGRS